MIFVESKRFTIFYMKHLVVVFVLLFGLNLKAQSEIFVGNYEVTYETNNANFQYQLALNSDGTFFFHYYENHFNTKQPEKNKYGKGTWRADNKIIAFFVDQEKDIDEKHQLNFNNSKARFISKSPRDTSDRVIKTELKFLHSNIKWMKGIGLYRI